MQKPESPKIAWDILIILVMLMGSLITIVWAIAIMTFIVTGIHSIVALAELAIR